MGQYFSNEKLPSAMQDYDAFILGQKFTFTTDNGVFSKKTLDFGTRVLLENIDYNSLTGKGLDVGCGVGVIGIIVSKKTGLPVEMIDVNKRALHLAKINAQKNGLSNVDIFESDCYENITKKYNFIITNPPIRAGKKIVYNIVMNARNYLVENGVLYIVVRKEQGAKSMINDLKKHYNVEIVNKVKGFFVLKCKIN